MAQRSMKFSGSQNLEQRSPLKTGNLSWRSAPVMQTFFTPHKGRSTERYSLHSLSHSVFSLWMDGRGGVRRNHSMDLSSRISLLVVAFI